MNLPIATLSVTVLIFATYSADVFAQSGSGGVDKEGSWYVGENLRVGDYFSYDLCYMGYKECTEFNMRIWFKEEVQTKDGTQWLADVVVTDDDRVVVGTMAPGGPVLWPYGASQELRVYGWAFESSVLFLSNFISFGSDSEEEKGKKFTDVWLFKIGSLCGFQLAPSNLDVVTVPAGTWEDAVVVSWSGCGNGKTWIADEFPLPLKADAYVHTRDGRSLEFAFTLVDYGNMQESPFIGIISTSEQERAACEARSGGIVPVRDATDGSKYEIFASYGPEHPEEGCRIELSMEFLGQDGLLLEQVQFDVVVLDDDGGITRSIADELGSRILYAQSGTYHLEFGVRESPGIAEYTIVVYGSAPDWVVPDQNERDMLTIPVEVRPNAGTAMPGSDGNALANEAGHARAPLAQARDGIPADKVACSDGRVRMASPSENPTCVFAESVEALERRGFTLPFDASNGDLSAKQPKASEKADMLDATKTSDRPFVTTWKTTPNESITIPTGGATGTYTVSWGDGSTSANVTGDQVHVYEKSGTYTVAITGNFERIYLNGDRNNAPKLQSIEQWGDISWTSMESAFYGASNMAYNAADSPYLSDVMDMSGMFHDASSFNGDISKWDVSPVADMSDMFHGAFSFNRDLSKWDVSHVTDMSGMFTGGLVGDAPGGGDVSSEPSVSFYYASSFNGDISEWDVSKVTDMSDMFHHAHHFNGDLSSWDVSGVTDMSGMFYGTSSFNGSISKWDVSHVTDMSNMFHGVFRFNSDLSSWDVSGVTDMSYMFLSSRFNGDLSSWDVSGVTDMSHMFARTYSFSSDLSEWNVSGVTDMSKMFYDTNSFNSNLSSWDVSSVTDMSGMFSYTDSFNSDLSSWDVSGVTDMSDMFLSSHFNGDLSSWDVSSVTDMSDMFLSSHFNGDLSSWDVSAVTSMHQMFLSSRFNGDLSSWDVSSVTGMGGMFFDASRFNSDLSSWDVSSVTYMGGMFNDAHSFNSDLSSWDVSGVTDMFDMFSGADSFNGNISTWDVSSVFRTLRMFYEADSFNGDLSSWDVSGMTDMLAMFHGASSFSQNLGNWYVVLDNASIDISSGATKIGSIAAQNPILDGQNPTYGMGSGADSDLFVIDGDDLMTKPSVDYSGKTGYAVNITSTGDFGKNNFRVINVTVTGTGNTELP